jgi:molybdenum cofactor synthesis domain-containing protein
MMSAPFEVVSVNVSTAKGTLKQPVAEGILTAQGLAGDAHAGLGHRQISLLASETIARFGAETGKVFKPGDFAENITTCDLDLVHIAPLDRLAIGDALLEVTQIGKSCHGERCAIFREVGRCVMPQSGVFCRVVRTGSIRAGDAGEFLPRPLTIRIITLSDRASRGEYEDHSGPKARELLEAFFAPRRWHAEFSSVILPDNVERIRAELAAAREAGVDIVVTSGGTGLGPRDIAPEAVVTICDKLIPGVMEAIRAKYGGTNPRALLSRSVAGVAGTTLIYALPGSPRAVEEYLSEILVTLEHLILMVHGLGH